MPYRFLRTVVAVSVLLAGELRAAQQESSGISATARPDSSDLHDAARDEQFRFERTRVRYAPRVWGSSRSSCDERIGRMCVQLDDDGPSEWDPLPEDSRVIEARRALLDALEEIGQLVPGDAWVLGQRVVYLGEAGDRELATRLARECGLAPESRWWCSALEGMSLHYLSRFEGAGEAFDDALAEMPDDMGAQWLQLDRVVDSGLRSLFEDTEADSLAALRDRLWVLGDPLFLVPGRDRETEHFARHTLAHARADARNPYGMRWGDDLTEILVRYGPEVAYEQDRDSRGVAGPTSVIGHFHPASARFLPLEDHFRFPGRVAPGSWRTDDTGGRSRYVPPYASLIGALEVQRARFRRGDDLLVVLGWAAAGSECEAVPFAIDRALDMGLFLLSDPGMEPEEGTSTVMLQRTDPGPADGPGLRGVASARVPEGEYLMSLELLDSHGHRAWRARQGIAQDSLLRGVIALSDLLLLEPRSAATDGRPAESPEGDALELHLGRVLPGGPRGRGRVEVAWEVYGLSGEEETLSFQLTAVREGRGFLRRAGEVLGLLQPVSPVQIDWREALERGWVNRCVNVSGGILPLLG